MTFIKFLQKRGNGILSYKFYVNVNKEKIMKKILLAAFISLFAMQVQAATKDLIDGVKSGNVSTVTALIIRGENVNGTDESGSTALHYAVAADNKEMVTLLLAFGADSTIANEDDLTAVDIAEQGELKNVTPDLIRRNQLPLKHDENSTK
jgi:ankyrin repeat protein